jgi:hypothetical protein
MPRLLRTGRQRCRYKEIQMTSIRDGLPDPEEVVDESLAQLPSEMRETRILSRTGPVGTKEAPDPTKVVVVGYDGLMSAINELAGGTGGNKRFAEKLQAAVGAGSDFDWRGALREAHDQGVSEAQASAQYDLAALTASQVELVADLVAANERVIDLEAQIAGLIASPDEVDEWHGQRIDSEPEVPETVTELDSIEDAVEANWEAPEPVKYRVSRARKS